MKYLLLVSGIFFGSIAFANDTTGWVSTGGVQYLKNPYIRMASEDLYLSTETVRVQYEFVNDSERDITETVLFPLPASNIQEYDSDFADIETLHESFKIWVNGKAVKPQKNLQAIWTTPANKTIDITHALTHECGFTKKQIAKPFSSESDLDGEKLSVGACLNRLIEKRIISKSDENQSVWDTQMVYSWQQTFPARQTLKVKHEYTPLVGGSVAGISSDDSEYGREMKKTYCFDQNFWRKMHGTPGIMYPAYMALGYILTTGANWSKPIEKFHLTIDKPKGSLMSLCWDASLKKISETRFEAHKTNFTPKQDIDIIFAMPSEIQE